MKFSRALVGLGFVGLFLSVSGHAQPLDEISTKILASGVPEDAYLRLVTFMQQNRGREFVIDTYKCKEKPEDSIKPCWEGDRTPSTQAVTFTDPRYVAIVDYSKPSSKERFFFIDLKEGTVEAYHASHGIGSGDGDWALRFSNIKDSRQTSLGFYVTGETYYGKYGQSLRMYGLDQSNKDSYNRDIVMHGAWYANESFISSINRKTSQPFGRLGLSWGCPAVAKSIAKKLIPLLKNGGIIYHYHADFASRTHTGEEIGLARPPQRPFSDKVSSSPRPPQKPQKLRTTNPETEAPENTQGENEI